MAPEMKTAQVNLRVSPSLKAAAQKAAADDHRSLTSLIEKLLADYVRMQQSNELRRPEQAA
jgi:hypothetical protein